MNKALLIIPASVAVAAFLLAPKAVAYDGLSGTSVLGFAGGNKSAARALIAQFDRNNFGGFFSRDGRTHGDVMAIFQIESNFDPKAYNPNDPSGAFGIGQVLATTAADRGYSDPTDLFRIHDGVYASMLQLKWSYDYLAGKLGRAPTKREWVGSYNAGVGNTLKGFVPLGYMVKWTAAKVLYG